MALRLTGKELRAVTFIDDFCAVRGFSPTFREVGAAIGWESTASVKRSMDKLRKAGLVEFEDGQPRTLRLSDRART